MCSKLKEFIFTNILRKITTFSLTAAKKISRNLVTVSRLVRVIDPTNFYVKIQRNLQASKEFSLISLDVSGSEAEVSIESHFLRWLHCLDNICIRIKAIHVYSSFYDSIENNPLDMSTFTPWSNLKKLAISGHYKNLLFFLQFPRAAWNLETISFRCIFISVDNIVDALHAAGPNLKIIRFENCRFAQLLPFDVLL